MMLFKMAAVNIKQNFKNYWAFFLSSSFSIFTIYIFMSIIYSQNVKKQLATMAKVMIFFNMGAVLTVLFAAFFIWYSNSFFIKARKKEFATYMLLGMSKKQTIQLNLIENFIILFLSFFSGVILGLIFNKFFMMLLFLLMRTQGTTSFELNINTFKVCLLIFITIFMIISFHSSVLISKSSLKDMFNASKKVEKGLRISPLTLVMSLVSLICIFYTYYIAIKRLGDNLMLAPEVLFFGILGNTLFFTSVISFIIGISKKRERTLFKNTKLITTAQLYQRYKGNVGAVSVIAVTTTIALCALVFCMGIFDKVEDNSRDMRPASIEYINDGDNNQDVLFESVLKKHSEISIKYSYNMSLMQAEGKIPLYNVDGDFFIINQSQFNKINGYEKVNRKIELANKGECYYIQTQGLNGDPKKVVNKVMDLKVGDKNYNFRILATDTKNFVALEHFRETLVVSDEEYNEIKRENASLKPYNIKAYWLKNDFIAKGFIKDLHKVIKGENNLLTFYEHYNEDLKVLGILAFIGIFIGILFVTATGSIIYFKMSMESTEDKNKFIILRKIGVSKKEISKVVSKELSILFVVPLILAILNTSVAAIPIGKMMNFSVAREALIIILVYTLIYMMYYLITLRKYISNVVE